MKNLKTFESFFSKPDDEKAKEIIQNLEKGYATNVHGPYNSSGIFLACDNNYGCDLNKPFSDASYDRPVPLEVAKNDRWIFDNPFGVRYNYKILNCSSRLSKKIYNILSKL